MYWSGTLYAEPLGAQTYPAQRLLNLRLSQPFAMGKGRQAEVFVDAFNLLNDCATLAWVTRANNTRLVNKVDDTFYADYRKPTLLETPRRVRVGFRMTF